MGYRSEGGGVFKFRDQKADKKSIIKQLEETDIESIDCDLEGTEIILRFSEVTMWNKETSIKEEQK